MADQKVLIVVDVQNDFCPGGALGVRDGDAIIPILNQYIDVFKKNNWPIIASRDWHPQKTKHFKSSGGLWPEHCIQNTEGAAFHPQLNLPSGTIILSKGIDPDKDGYSAFEAVNDWGHGLLEVLSELIVKEIFIGGLATDYCVRSTVLEALKNFKVNLLVDAIKGVNLEPDDSKKAIDEMVAGGVIMVTFDEFIKKEALNG